MILSFASIEIHDEPAYSFGSADNSRSYRSEKKLSPDGHVSSVHGVVLDGEAVLALGGGGGATSVHQNSALVLAERLYVAVGKSLACIVMRPAPEVLWTLEVDDATCFGVHYSHQHGAIVCHGELAISRVSPDGVVLWSSFGTDIFTGALLLTSSEIVAEDFNGRSYRYCYTSGAEI
jgi:hypothetical protein